MQKTYFSARPVLVLVLITMVLAATSWCKPAHAGGQQSVFFQISGRHLVQQHAYYRERHLGPACTNRVGRNSPCLGKNGLIVWR